MRAVGPIDYVTADREFKDAIAVWFETHGVTLTDVVTYELVGEGLVCWRRYAKDSEGRYFDDRPIEDCLIASNVLPPFPVKGTWIEYPDGIPQSAAAVSPEDPS